GDSLREMLESGVQYVEFRSFDLNPLDRLGISYEQGRFYHLFFLYLVWVDNKATREEILQGQEKMLNTADENPYQVSEYQKAGLKILAGMLDMVNDLSSNDEIQELRKKAQEKFHHPAETLSARVADKSQKQAYLAFNRPLGLKFKEHSTERPYALNGSAVVEL